MRRSRATSTAERLATAKTPQYTFVGGKGGVGKTTCAAAMAIRSAENGVKTLVISTDPAPSLGDALQQRLGPKPRPVRDRPRLYAVELDAAAALAAWIAPRRATLEELALRGTWLDRGDVRSLLDLSLPGIDEVAALLQIAGLANLARYEEIIVDTAPTGHLLRMLGMPEVLGGFARVFDDMQVKHRIMVETLRGSWAPDAVDALIGEMRSDALSLSTLLRDPARARVTWVTLAEAMAVEETADGIRWLRDHGITVDVVVTNRVTPSPRESCVWCLGRRQVEQRAIESLRRLIGSTARIASVPAMGREPRGVAALGPIGKMLDAPERAQRRQGRRRAPLVTAMLPTGPGPIASSDVVTSATRLVMFGGKGGVGKTTCAAAVALDIAGATRLRVLLLSTDPAHSVGDVLGQRFSDEPRLVRGGPRSLWVREVNTERAFNELRKRFTDAIEDLFATGSTIGTIAGTMASDDRQVMRDLIDLAPPGVDELVAIVEVTEALVDQPRDQSRYDLIVMDMAPTGHALRLIEMPALVHQWVKALMAILLKYQPVVGVGELGAVLLRLSRHLGRLREIITDPVRTRFVAVTRAAALPRAETLRLLERLRLSRISAPLVIVNAFGAGTCARCKAEMHAEKREIAALRKSLGAAGLGRTRLVFTPAQVPPPRGQIRLRNWRARWRGDTGGRR